VEAQGTISQRILTVADETNSAREKCFFFTAVQNSFGLLRMARSSSHLIRFSRSHPCKLASIAEPIACNPSRSFAPYIGLLSGFESALNPQAIGGAKIIS
jgi:hypothetical protein